MSKLTQNSKFLSLVLRHKPDVLGINILEDGWTEVNHLLTKCKELGREISLKDLEKIVNTDEKKRYSFKDDRKYIRANEGRSIKIAIKFEEKIPPVLLYHGTAKHNIKSINEEGICRMDNYHVHLSTDIETATKIGQRHGDPVVYEIKALELWKRGFTFYLSENIVWLTDWVPVNYLTLLPPPVIDNYEI